MRRAFIIGIAALTLVAVASGRGAAQSYPTREIEFVIPFAPGGPADAAARLIAPLMSKRLGVPIVLTNKDGGGGAVGAAHVAGAAPDGYTVLAAVNAPLSVAPATRKVPYGLGDLAAVGSYMVDFQLIAVHASAPWKTLEEFVGHAKRNPGKLTYGSPGLGTVSYFNMELLKLNTGIEITHVPPRGTGPVKNAILGKHVDVATSAAGAMLPLARSGDIRLLVTTAPRRLADFPDVPTMVDKGFGEASLSTWAGLVVPARTPRAIVDRLAAALREAAADPALADTARKAGLNVEYLDPTAMAAQIQREFTAVKTAADRLGIGQK